MSLGVGKKMDEILIVENYFQDMSTYCIGSWRHVDQHNTKDELRDELVRVTKHLVEKVTGGFYDLGHPDVKHEVVSCAHRATKLIAALAEKRKESHPDYHQDCGFEFHKYY